MLNPIYPAAADCKTPLNVIWFVPEPEKYWAAIVLSSTMSVAPSLFNKMYALFVTVWFDVAVALVKSIASSNVSVISNVALSAYAPSVQSIDLTVAEPATAARFLIHTRTSG